MDRVSERVDSGHFCLGGLLLPGTFVLLCWIPCPAVHMLAAERETGKEEPPGVGETSVPQIGANLPLLWELQVLSPGPQGLQCRVALQIGKLRPWKIRNVCSGGSRP